VLAGQYATTASNAFKVSAPTSLAMPWQSGWGQMEAVLRKVALFEVMDMCIPFYQLY
jgi:hypothetical protein